MADGAWTVADAKARFSALMEQARTKGPQRVTRHGRDAVVVVSAAHWESLTRPTRSLVEVLLDPAVRGIRMQDEESIFERDRMDDRAPPAF